MLKSRRLLIIIAVILMIVYPSFASPIVPHMADRDEVFEFLTKLNKFGNGYFYLMENYDASDGHAVIYLQQKNEDAFFSGAYLLWVADVNNDGKEEYLWTVMGEGYGHYDHFSIYSENKDSKIIELECPLYKVDKISVSEGYNYMDGNIQEPPILYRNGITYLMLENIWSEDKNGNILATGANCNAAKGAYYLIIVKYKYKWDKTGMHLISQDKSKEKFAD